MTKTISNKTKSTIAKFWDEVLKDHPNGASIYRVQLIGGYRYIDVLVDRGAMDKIATGSKNDIIKCKTVRTLTEYKPVTFDESEDSHEIVQEWENQFQFEDATYRVLKYDLVTAYIKLSEFALAEELCEFKPDDE